MSQHTFWIKRAQQSTDTQEDRLRLNLHPNREEILECRGRIQREYPIYLPDSHSYTKKLVQQEHMRTLHGGVLLTMTSIRKSHWIPRLRRLSKRTVRECNGCKRFQARAVANPPPGNLPVDRTQGTHPFQVIGVDYAGPLHYRKRGKVEGKAYIAIICLFVESYIVPGRDDFPRNPRVPLKLKKVHRKEGKAAEDIFRQWIDICWCDELVEEGDGR